METKRGIANILTGSVLGAAFTAILVGFATIDPYPNDLAYFIGIAAITLVSTFLIQKTVQKNYPKWVYLAALGLSFLALYLSFGLQTRQWERLYYLPSATGILIVLNLAIFLIRSKFSKKPARTEDLPPPHSGFWYPGMVLAITLVVPVLLTLFVDSYMPPRVEPGGSVSYDQTILRGGVTRPGLSLSFWALTYGNAEDYHWVPSAYLVSREWTTSPDEPWKAGSYTRRAKFYNEGAESFDRNSPGDFEGDSNDATFFLPYGVVQEGLKQGDFPNYDPQPLASIITGSDRVQFGVETVTTVSGSRGKIAREGVYGKERSTVIVLDAYAGHAFEADNYATSRWVAMVSGGSTGRPGSEGMDGIPGPFKEGLISTPEPASITFESGTASWDPEKGLSVFEGNEMEVAPGIMLKRTAALVQLDPANEQQGYKALTMLRFRNTTGEPQKMAFIEEIPKKLARHVNELRFKVHSGDPEVSVNALLADTEGFVGISDLVNSGYAEVIEEDPIVSFIVWGAVGTAVLSQVVTYFVPHWVGVQPRMDDSKWKAMTEEQVLEWINTRLDPFCDVIKQSAAKNNIPPRLLATVVLNELADYEYVDQLEELANFGAGHSAGWVQLQPKRVREHGVIDVGSRDQIRDPSVDIVLEDVTGVVAPNYPGGAPIVFDNVLRRDQLIWNRLVNPKSAIELAAREVAYLLNLLKKGSPFTKNPWAQSLLKNPDEGINLDHIYENLKMSETRDDTKGRQIELEKTLAILAVSAYNGSGAIYAQEDKDAIFSFNHNPWGPGSEYGPDGKKRPFYQPRVHAVNAAEELTQRLYESSCLKERGLEVVPPPPPADRDLGNLTAREILARPGEIGEGFVGSTDSGVDDISADVQFKHWDKGITINAHIRKMISQPAHDQWKNDYVTLTRQKMSDPRYVVEKLPLGDFSYLVYFGKASFAAESYPGEIWHLEVDGSYYSFSGDYEAHAAEVKQAVIRALTAMHNRVVQREPR